MNTFTFTDNSGMQRHVVTLDAKELAEHLSNDPQFMFYWRKGWEPRLAATRSLYMLPPHPKAIVSPKISDTQWPEIDAALRAIENDKAQ